MEYIKPFLNYFQENWPELLWLAAVSGIGTYWAARRARARWRKRDFLHRLNVSLTRIENGRLQIRTILEKDCEEIFLNDAATKNVVDAAAKTTTDNPLLPFPDKDYWLYLNAVLNEVSERFSAGYLRRDQGLEVNVGTYLLCLTCERAGPVRTQKIRGLLVKKNFLTDLPVDPPEYEAREHSTRWDTLHQLAGLYEKKPDRFIEMEICM